MSSTIERTLQLDAPPERVWRAITDPDEIATWFADRVEIELREGGGGRLDFDGCGSYPIRVEVVEPPHRLAWRWCHEAEVAVESGTSTLVEWTITAVDGGGSVLHLRESGFVKREHARDNDDGWKKMFGRLETVLAGNPTPQQAVSG